MLRNQFADIYGSLSRVIEISVVEFFLLILMNRDAYVYGDALDVALQERKYSTRNMVCLLSHTHPSLCCLSHFLSNVSL